MNANDIELALRARAVFNGSVDRIDIDTLRRLRDLRLHAQQVEPRRSSARWVWPAAAGLTAALALVAFLPHMPRAPAVATPAPTVSIVPPVAPPTMVARTSAATVADVVAADAVEAVDPDMLSELDFYGWLAKQPGNSATGG